MIKLKWCYKIIWQCVKNKIMWDDADTGNIFINRTKKRVKKRISKRKKKKSYNGRSNDVKFLSDKEKREVYGGRRFISYRLSGVYFSLFCFI